MKNNKIFSICLTVLCLALLNGCGTITRGTKDVLVIESEPSGATVQLSTGLQGKTPATFELSRKHDLVVTISKEGYETVNVNVVPKVAGAGGAAMAGNVVLGGLVGAAVDAGTGSMYDLKPNPVHVVLNKISSEANTSKTKSSTASLEESLKELDNLKAKGIINADEYAVRRKKIIEGS
jgi:hypothetical protein